MKHVWNAVINYIFPTTTGVQLYVALLIIVTATLLTSPAWISLILGLNDPGMPRNIFLAFIPVLFCAFSVYILTFLLVRDRQINNSIPVIGDSPAPTTHIFIIYVLYIADVAFKQIQSAQDLVGNEQLVFSGLLAVYIWLVGPGILNKIPYFRRRFAEYKPISPSIGVLRLSAAITVVLYLWFVFSGLDVVRAALPTYIVSTILISIFSSVQRT